jgi:hypothetical protein
MMNCETGFLHSVGFWSVPVCRSVEDPREARHWGRAFVLQTCPRGCVEADSEASQNSFLCGDEQTLEAKTRESY